MTNEIAKELYEETLGNLITEELSVSDEVIKATDKIWEEIKRDIILYKERHSNSIPENRITRHDFYTTIFGFDVRITWNYISTKSEEEARSLCFNDISTGIEQLGFRYISIPIYAVNHEIIEYLTLENLQHEISHVWEEFKYPSEVKKTTYEYGVWLINNAKTKAVKAIGCIIYLSKDWEIRAFINGSYSYLMKFVNITNKFDVFDNVDDTTIVHALVDVRNALSDLKRLGPDFGGDKDAIKVMQTLRKKYGIKDFDTLIKIGENTQEKLSRGLRRVITKVLNDIGKKPVFKVTHTMIRERYYDGKEKFTLKRPDRKD